MPIRLKVIIKLIKFQQVKQENNEDEETYEFHSTTIKINLKRKYIRKKTHTHEDKKKKYVHSTHFEKDMKNGK